MHSPELLESRQLLSTIAPAYAGLYIPSDLRVTNPLTHERVPVSVYKLYQHGNPDSPLLNNRGKIVSGKDRQGNEWTITVHGPGQVIVTDTTPNDGSLDDDIATIQIINSDPRRTYVTGNVVGSARVLTDGTVKFNRLLAIDGVREVVLNGFNLSRDVNPPVPEATGIFLLGGVQRLSLNNILAVIDTSVDPTPYQIIIGDPSTPLTVKPSIYLNSIYNSVFDSTAETIPTGPLTSPSVQFSINGVVQDFSVVAIIQSPLSPAYLIQTRQGTARVWDGVPASGPDNSAAYQFLFNVVGTTGRTSLQALAVNNLNVRGRANNFTAQRTTEPFSSSLGGLDFLRRARFGGNADAVALDVNGPIGHLAFHRGYGNPDGVFTGQQTAVSPDPGTQPFTVPTPATTYGVPLGSTGYPAAGLQGGAVQATRIQHLRVRPANQILQTAQNPDFVQLRRQGSTTFFANPGTALTNVAITTDGGIGGIEIEGNQLNSEIKTGFNYASYLAGLEGTRSPSLIAQLHQRGDLINGVTSATFRPANNAYSFATGTAGPGAIFGRFRGRGWSTGGRTALGNLGAGFYARLRSPGLPPTT